MSMTVLNRLQQIEDVVRSADDAVDAVEDTGLRAVGIRSVFVAAATEERQAAAGATDKCLLSAVNFASEIEREKARQRTYDAMVRKARAGHATGGRTFGYSNYPIIGPDGRRERVERQINEQEATLVRRIFSSARLAIATRASRKH